MNLYFYLQGLVARAKETFLTLMLLSCVIMGMMYILAALIDWDERSLDRLISEFSLFLKKENYWLLMHFTLVLHLKNKHCTCRCLLLFAFLVLLRLVSRSTHVAIMYSIGFCQIVWHRWRLSDKTQLDKKFRWRILLG